MICSHNLGSNLKNCAMVTLPRSAGRKHATLSEDAILDQIHGLAPPTFSSLPVVCLRVPYSHLRRSEPGESDEEEKDDQQDDDEGFGDPARSSGMRCRTFHIGIYISEFIPRSAWLQGRVQMRDTSRRAFSKIQTLRKTSTSGIGYTVSIPPISLLS